MFIYAGGSGFAIRMFPFKCTLCRWKHRQIAASGHLSYGGTLLWGQAQKRWPLKVRKLWKNPFSYNFKLALMSITFTCHLFHTESWQSHLCEQECCTMAGKRRKGGGGRGAIQTGIDRVPTCSLPDHYGHAALGGGRDQQDFREGIECWVAARKYQRWTARPFYPQSDILSVCVGIMGAMWVHFRRWSCLGPPDAHSAVRMSSTSSH